MKEYNYHSNIMGCDFDLTFISNSVEKADNYFTRAFAIAQSYEKRFSRFDKNSELFQLNKYKSLVVSQDFLDIYYIANDLYKKTQKKFNPLIQVSKIGYNKSFDKLNKNQVCNLNYEQYNINLEDIIIEKNKISLTNNQSLDFGGFLKGYVVQKIVHDINDGMGMIINIGGDLYVSGLDCEENPFEIEIMNPQDKSKNTKVFVSNKALCTSGIYKRKWRYGNKRKHHILDVNCRDSAITDIESVSVLHENGAIADAYATMSVAMGKQKSIDFFKSQNIDFVIICTNGNIIISDNIKQ